MTIAEPSSISHLFFRGGARFVGVLPAWLLRLRPFGVYEILTPHLESNRTTVEESATEVRWISSNEEAGRLANVATQENIAAWDGVTRRAVAAWRDNEAVAVAWIAAESFHETDLGVHFRLAPKDVWLFASVVAPEFRRQGIYGQMLRFLVDEFRSTNVERILLGISVGNRPSFGAHTQQGATQLGSIFAIKSLGLVLCRCGGRVRRLSRIPIAWCRPIRLSVD